MQQPPSAPPLVIRMTPETQRSFLRLNVAIAVPVAVMLILLGLLQLILSQWLGLALVVLGALMIPLTLLLVRFAVRRSRIEAAGGHYLVAQGLLRTRRVTAAEVARVVSVDRMTITVAADTAHVFLLGADRRLAWLIGTIWDRAQLGALVQDLAARGVEHIHVDRPITAPELRAWDARTLHWRDAHRWAFALLVGAAVFVGLLLLGAIAIVVAIATFS